MASKERSICSFVEEFDVDTFREHVHKMAKPSLALPKGDVLDIYAIVASGKQLGV